MAESEPIKREDIIEDGVFDPSIEGAKELLVVIEKLEGSIKQLAIESTKLFAVNIKTLDQLEEFNQRTDQLLKTEKLQEQLKQQKLKTEQELQKSLKAKTDAQKAEIALNEKTNKQLKDTSGIIGQLVARKKELQGKLLGAKTEEEIKNINKELFGINTKLKDVKDAGTKTFNSWGNALESFQFKFNTLGNVVGGFAAGLVSGGLSSVITLVTDGITKLVSTIGKESEAMRNNKEVVKEYGKSHKDAIKDINELELEVLVLNGTITQGQADIQKTVSQFQSARKDMDKRHIEERKKLRLADFKSEKEFQEATNSLLDAQQQEREDLEIVKSKTLKVIRERNKIERKKEAEEDEKDALSAQKDAAKKRLKAEEDEANENNRIWQNSFKKKQDDAERINKEIQKAAEEQRKADDAQREYDRQQEEEEARINKQNIEKAAAEARKAHEEQLQREADFRAELVDLYIRSEEKKLGNSAEDQRKLKQLNDLKVISEIGLAYYNLFQKYSKDPEIKNPAMKAATDTFTAKTLGKLVTAGMGLYEGADEVTEDHGINIPGRTKDNILVPLHKGERVVGYDDSMRIAGMSNEDVVRAAEMYRDGTLADVSMQAQLAGALLSKVSKEISAGFDKLNKTIENKKEWHVGQNDAGEIIIGIKEKGVMKETTYKDSPIVPTPRPFNSRGIN